MISYFLKGQKAARLGFGTSLCMLEGEARVEWMVGFNSYQQKPTEFVDVELLCDEFAKKHFKNYEDEISTN